jgi:hypothetical protein
MSTSIDFLQGCRLRECAFPDVVDQRHRGIVLPLKQRHRHACIHRRGLGLEVLLKQFFRRIAEQGLIEMLARANQVPHTDGPEPRRVTIWTHSTEAVISPNKTYLLVRAYVTGSGGICLQSFDFLFSKEPAAFARFEALTDHFCGHFRHQLPGPNVKTEALVGFQGRGMCRGHTTPLLSPFPP